MFQAQDSKECQLSLHSLLLKKETMNVLSLIMYRLIRTAAVHNLCSIVIFTMLTHNYYYDRGCLYNIMVALWSA